MPHICRRLCGCKQTDMRAPKPLTGGLVGAGPASSGITTATRVLSSTLRQHVDKGNTVKLQPNSWVCFTGSLHALVASCWHTHACCCLQVQHMQANRGSSSQAHHV